MSDAPAAARRQEAVEELCAAVIRALAGRSDLRFRGRRLHQGGRALPLFAPHLHPSIDDDDFASFRGAADGLALRVACSDAALHRSLAPADPVERLLFDWLEQFRVESIAPPALAGVARNLRHRHEAWSLAFHHAGHTAGPRGLVLYTLAQVARARVSGEPVVEATEDLIEASRFALAPRIGHGLAQLRRARHDQARYAAVALAIASAVAALLREIAPGDGEDDADAAPDDDARRVLGLLMDDDEAATASEGFGAAASGPARVLDDDADDYRVFSTAWDREANAGALVRAEALAACRARLDARIAAHGVNVARLARELRLVFGTPAPDGWDGAREEGRIDGRALARLVATPSERRLFRSERVEASADCALAFLIDCSGSMKAHAESVAVLVDVFARAFEAAGGAVEILGFTTAAWNGGRAQRAWVAAGKPARPGRLNEGLHIVFKPFETPWRRSRAGVAALLRDELFKEGLDGEALDWAAGRLLAREERRKVLVVVSDGAPMDSATALANDARTLERHLRQVADRLERGGRVELHGIGVGLDLSAFYRSGHVLDLGGRIGNAMFSEVLAQIGGMRRRR